jgi:indolepyruvate ferredoxin oxidoreductase alpha subunit
MHMTNQQTTISLNGEDALARGALASGVRTAAGYPGSPGIGVMNFLIDHARQHPDLYVEWSLNERIALEICIGASIAGQRSLVCIKSVGMNVLLDPLMTLNLTGTHGGLVIILGDDPGAYGSQNEQDTRLIAPLIEIPMLEPAMPGEAFEMIQHAFDLSERHKTAVVLRITRSFSQHIDPLNLTMISRRDHQLELARQPYRFFPYPGNAVEMHRQMHLRLEMFHSDVNASRWDQIQGSGSLGVIAAGYTFSKMMDVIRNSTGHDLSILKLSTLFPLPEKIISQFLGQCQSVLVLEECDAYIETAIKAIAFDQKAQVSIVGKHTGHLPVGDELLRWQIQNALERFSPGIHFHHPYLEDNQAAERPKKHDHCADSPNDHILALIRQVAAGLEQDPILVADPGCWVKVAGELDAKYAIGSAVAVASGLEKSGVKQPVVALFGDSAFFHTAIPAICNAAYQQAHLFILILNNSGAQSTGKQPTPACGVDALGRPAPILDIVEIAKVCGVSEVHHLPPGASDEEIKTIIKMGLTDKCLSMLVLDVS